MLPYSFGRSQVCPKRSERVRTRPKTSKKLAEPRDICEKLRKLGKDISIGRRRYMGRRIAKTPCPCHRPCEHVRIYTHVLQLWVDSRFGGIPVRRNPGSPESRFAGIPVRRSPGSHESRFAGIPIPRNQESREPGLRNQESAEPGIYGTRIPRNQESTGTGPRNRVRGTEIPWNRVCTKSFRSPGSRSPWPLILASRGLLSLL